MAYGNSKSFQGELASVLLPSVNPVISNTAHPIIDNILPDPNNKIGAAGQTDATGSAGPGFATVQLILLQLRHLRHQL